MPKIKCFASEIGQSQNEIMLLTGDRQTLFGFCKACHNKLIPALQIKWLNQD